MDGGGARAELIPLATSLDEDEEQRAALPPFLDMEEARAPPRAAPAVPSTPPGRIGVLTMQGDNGHNEGRVENYDDSALLPPSTPLLRATPPSTSFCPPIAAGATHNIFSAREAHPKATTTTEFQTDSWKIRRPHSSNFFNTSSETPGVAMSVEERATDVIDFMRATPTPSDDERDDDDTDSDAESVFEQEPDLLASQETLKNADDELLLPKEKELSPPIIPSRRRSGDAGLLFLPPSEQLNTSRDMAMTTTVTDFDSTSVVAPPSPPRSPLRSIINPQPYSSPSSSFRMSIPDLNDGGDDVENDTVDDELIGDYSMLPGRVRSTNSSRDEESQQQDMDEIMVDQVPSSFVLRMYGSAYDQIFSSFGLTPDNAGVSVTAFSRNDSIHNKPKDVSPGRTSRTGSDTRGSTQGDDEDDEESCRDEEEASRRRVPRSAKRTRRTKRLSPELLKLRKQHKDPTGHQSVLSTKILFGTCRLDVAIALLAVAIAVCLCAAIVAAYVQHGDSHNDGDSILLDEDEGEATDLGTSLSEEEAANTLTAVPTPSPTYY